MMTKDIGETGKIDTYTHAHPLSVSDLCSLIFSFSHVLVSHPPEAHPPREKDKTAAVVEDWS